MPQPLFRRSRTSPLVPQPTESADPSERKPIAALSPKEVKRRSAEADQRGQDAFLRLSTVLGVPILGLESLPRSATDAQRELASLELWTDFLSRAAAQLDEWLDSPSAA